jgi:hypothetical protein
VGESCKAGSEAAAGAGERSRGDGIAPERR